MDHLKSLLVDQLGVPAWIWLALAGLVCFAGVNVGLRKPILSAWGLFGAIAFAVIWESLEIWSHYRHIGLLNPRNDPVQLILMRHARDVMIVSVTPLILVVVGRFFR